MRVHFNLGEDFYRKVTYKWVKAPLSYSKISVFYCLLLVVLITRCGATEIRERKGISKKINGMALESPSSPVDSSAFQPLRDLHINSIAVIPYAFSRKGEPKVYYNNDHQWWGERIEGAAELIDIAHKHGFSAMLKPQVWMHHDWIGTFQLDTEEQWLDWEKSYLEYVLAYAKMAEAHHADVFCIGTELKMAASSRPLYFRKLIGKVREVFDGKITYASNWDSYELIDFWDELDFIGINAYFPLSQKENPTLTELETAWKPILRNLNQFHSEFNKPILITEFGYRSVNGAAGNQWDLDSERVNNQLQSRAFKAFFEMVYPKEWISGVYIWKWEFGDRNRNNLQSRGKRYTPQGKPSSEIISHYFKLYSQNQ